MDILYLLYKHTKIENLKDYDIVKIDDSALIYSFLEI